MVGVGPEKPPQKGGATTQVEAESQTVLPCGLTSEERPQLLVLRGLAMEQRADP